MQNINGDVLLDASNRPVRCDSRAFPEAPTVTFTASQTGEYVLDVVEPKWGCRHICGCSVRGSSYRITLERAAAPR